MPNKARFRIHLDLRRKLLLVSLVLLIIPWMGSRYIRDMEGYLRENQEYALLDRTQDVSAILQAHRNLFNAQPADSRSNTRHLYVRPLKHAIQLDGYTNDWQAYEERIEILNDEHLIYRGPDYQANSLSVKQQIGRHGRYLYALFQVQDERIIYRNPNSIRLDRNDHLTIAMLNPQGDFIRYQVATIAPGWVNAHRLSDTEGADLPVSPEFRIKGEWQAHKQGYNIEIRIPLSMIGNRLSFTITDVDDPVHRDAIATIGGSNTTTAEELGTLMVPSPEVEQLLDRLTRPSSRIWVIDQQFRVLGIAGELSLPAPAHKTSITEKSLFTSVLDRLYQLILEQPATSFIDDLSTASHLDSIEIRNALGGTPATHWRANINQRTNILTAAYPVYDRQRVIGAVAIEETNHRILLLQNRAMEILLNLSLLALLCAVLVLLFFASRLSTRIRRLRNEAEQAIAPDGKVLGEITTSKSSDEIGDLSRSFAGMLHRLAQYNRYLETLASKLSHELRTPITVVKSSLDNLESQRKDESTLQYTRRAKEGLARLHNILNRMSEATRLEQTLQSETIAAFNLTELLTGCVEGYRLAHPHYNFQLVIDNPGTMYEISGSAELIAQMLDKLIDNAIDFAIASTPIEIKLSSSADEAVLSISNQGPPIPDAIAGQMFDSMVSQRDKRTDHPHLGLGLYIVRMIIEFHHGTIIAQNRSDNSGVEFIIHLPLSH